MLTFPRRARQHKFLQGRFTCLRPERPGAAGRTTRRRSPRRAPLQFQQLGKLLWIGHRRFAGEIFAGVRGRLRQGKDVQRHRLGRPTLFMNEAPNSFRRLARKGSFAATFADLRGNVLNEHTASVDHEHFTHKIRFCCRITANVASKHGYFRLR